jgi:hypothetical protein
LDRGEDLPRIAFEPVAAIAHTRSKTPP